MLIAAPRCLTARWGGSWASPASTGRAAGRSSLRGRLDPLEPPRTHLDERHAAGLAATAPGGLERRRPARAPLAGAIQGMAGPRAGQEQEGSVLGPRQPALPMGCC